MPASTGRVGLKSWQLPGKVRGSAAFFSRGWRGGRGRGPRAGGGAPAWACGDGASPSPAKGPRPFVSRHSRDSRLGQPPALDRIASKPPRPARALGAVPAAHPRRRLPSSGPPRRGQRCQAGRAAPRRGPGPDPVVAAIDSPRRWSPAGGPPFTGGRVAWAPPILHRRRLLSFPAGSYRLPSGSEEAPAAPSPPGRGPYEPPQETTGLFPRQPSRPSPPRLLFRSPQARVSCTLGGKKGGRGGGSPGAAPAPAWGRDELSAPKAVRASEVMLWVWFCSARRVGSPAGERSAPDVAVLAGRVLHRADLGRCGRIDIY